MTVQTYGMQPMDFTDPSACNATEIDPKFTNPESGDFTVGAEDIKDSKAGDPRWIKE